MDTVPGKEAERSTLESQFSGRDRRRRGRGPADDMKRHHQALRHPLRKYHPPPTGAHQPARRLEKCEGPR